MEKLLNLSASALENNNDIMKVAPDIVRFYLPMYLFDLTVLRAYGMIYFDDLDEVLIYK